MSSYKYIINISYDGTKYNGYATQPNNNTIQDILEDSLKKLNSNVEVKTFATSRTDSGVHAKDQYVQFSFSKRFELNLLKKKLNSILPNDICIKNVIEDFEDKLNVRYDVNDKTYKYLITLEKNPFLTNYSYFIEYKVDIKKMIEAASVFIGTHDFSAVSNSNTNVVNKIRTVNYLNIKQIILQDSQCIEITINADGYLYNMVRIIVGCLLEVGRNKISNLELENILKNKKRTNHCACVPAQGLFLEKTRFKDNYENNFNS